MYGWICDIQIMWQTNSGAFLHQLLSLLTGKLSPKKCFSSSIFGCNRMPVLVRLFTPHKIPGSGKKCVRLHTLLGRWQEGVSRKCTSMTSARWWAPTNTFGALARCYATARNSEALTRRCSPAPTLGRWKYGVSPHVPGRWQDGMPQYTLPGHWQDSVPPNTLLNIGKMVCSCTHFQALQW